MTVGTPTARMVIYMTNASRGTKHEKKVVVGVVGVVVGVIESEGKCGGVHDSQGTRGWKNNILTSAFAGSALAYH